MQIGRPIAPVMPARFKMPFVGNAGSFQIQMKLLQVGAAAPILRPHVEIDA